MKYRITKEKLEAKGFYLSAHQTDYELPMLHYQHPTIKGSNWEITLHFSHDTVIPEDVENGREYSFDEEWVYPHARSGNSSTLYRSIGIKFELHDYAGIWFEMDVLTWKMHGHIKIAPGFCENDSAYFDSTTSIKDFRTELGVQYQEHLWYLEKMKNVRAISATDVILKDGTRVKYSEL